MDFQCTVRRRRCCRAARRRARRMDMTLNNRRAMCTHTNHTRTCTRCRHACAPVRRNDRTDKCCSHSVCAAIRPCTVRRTCTAIDPASLLCALVHACVRAALTRHTAALHVDVCGETQTLPVETTRTVRQTVVRRLTATIDGVAYARCRIQ
jgi:hypothetical protein